MRSVHTSASTQLHFWLSASLPCLGVSSTFDSSSCFVIDSTHPPSWRAFAPPALPGFFTTTPPLTSAGLLPGPFADLLALRHLNFPPFHLQPPQGLTRCLFHVTHQALVRVRFPFHSSFAISQQAAVPSEPNRSPTDWWFSFGCFNEYGPENVCPVGTFTLLFKCAYERTRSRLRAAI